MDPRCFTRVELSAIYLAQSHATRSTPITIGEKEKLTSLDKPKTTTPEARGNVSHSLIDKLLSCNGRKLRVKTGRIKRARIGLEHKSRLAKYLN